MFSENFLKGFHFFYSYRKIEIGFSYKEHEKITFFEVKKNHDMSLLCDLRKLESNLTGAFIGKVFRDGKK